MNTKLICLTAIAAVALANAGESAFGQLEKDFQNPPDATRPRCYWYWMDGNYTKEGITHDLEAMKRVGIGEGYIGLISGQCDIAAGDVKVLTEPFWDILAHTIREGDRLGVDIGLFNSPGWSQSGGPWIKPEQAMRYMASYETNLHGPQSFAGKLPSPTGTFQDITVLAFPAPLNDADTVAAHAPKISTAPNAANAKNLFDGDLKSTCKLDAGQVLVELDQPFTARSVVIYPANTFNVSCELQVSEDGKEFHKVRTFQIDRHNGAVNVGPVPMAPVAVSFPATTGRFFRFNFSGGCTLGEICLSGASRLESYAEKQLMKVFQDPQPPFDFYSWPAQAEPENPGLAVDPKNVLDLSKQMSPDGTLRWNVPAGDWIVVRTAAVPTGTKNSPAPPEATGFEVDKMSRKALQAHFDSFIGELLRRVPAQDRKAWKHVVADSYEMGPQNWTDGFFADFQKRYGYDAKPFLPALGGRVVGSAERSDRFLWDVRRMVADRVSLDYVGGLRDLCHANGLKMWLENYGHWGFPGEFLQYGGESDEVSGEFWATGSLGSVELRDASSAAHIYGKPVVFAEAFTGGPLFTSHPYSLKAREDWSYCEGINQFTLHVNIHQPWDDRKPGIAAWFGTEFNRQNTWFESGKVWIDYQRRCSVLLQQGKYVADVAYFIGEDTPKMAGQRKPALPPGYSFDYINAEVIQNRMRVENGRFVLPDGMSYRVLVLPGEATMRPALLKNIRALVADGGVVLGEPPTHSPSLQDYPQCDVEVARLKKEIWGNCDGKNVTSAQFGNGYVFRGMELAPALAKLGVSPDLSGVDARKILFIHRSAPDAEIYFLSNQSSSSTDITPTFRVAGRSPELWHADTGEIERPAVYESDGKSVTLPLHLGPVGSVFVVFREQQSSNHIVEVLRDGKPMTSVGKRPLIKIQKAIYGVPGDSARSRDVRTILQAMADKGEVDFHVGDLANSGDPAYQVVKTLTVEYTAAGQPLKISGQDTDDRSLIAPLAEARRAAEIRFDKTGNLSIAALKTGRYELKTASGKVLSADVPTVPAPIEIGGWNVAFPADSGIANPLKLEKLASWTEHSDPRVKYFSGKAAYQADFEVPAGWTTSSNEIFLDLGGVEVMADVVLNGHNLGTLWKPPFRVEIGNAVKPGVNHLEVRVVNVWRNRLVGQLKQPEAFAGPGVFQPVVVGARGCDANSPLFPSGLLGPVTVQAVPVVRIASQNH